MVPGFVKVAGLKFWASPIPGHKTRLTASRCGSRSRLVKIANTRTLLDPGTFLAERRPQKADESRNIGETQNVSVRNSPRKEATAHVVAEKRLDPTCQMACGQILVSMWTRAT